MKAQNPITRGDLFTMTAGFSYNFNTAGNLNAPKAKKELLTYLNSSRIENVTNDDIAQLLEQI